jgi:hypothetical protein
MPRLLAYTGTRLAVVSSAAVEWNRSPHSIIYKPNFFATRLT